ncbi:Mg2+ and Co2+ transporter CorB [Petroclostridium sp. X23]|uniref:Mg2+ and Co2+ transporter CorB n=1 Tax=Petroclostridium sp. X23 TaxID=3045146 RepID=UPI0024ACFCFD|nr:Mg2+ and Co2+ transporter CorB [Petroclostridium sp. X23]WHH59634.1 Mg2+ and Co2+ transporter CorB [Petroclostridium sp. X23]
MRQQATNKKINKQNRIKLRNTNVGNKKVSYTWAVIIVIWTFIFSITLSYVSSSLMNNVSIGVAFFILLFIVLLGIIFDIIGIAVAAANETPFHAMASRKIAGAKQAVRLIRNAEKVSNFCNDVVGDIAGIISGATSATIVAQITTIYNIFDTVMIGLVLTGFVASLTVGGKALGKSVALSRSNYIVYKVGIILYYLNSFIRFKKVDKR